MSIRNVALQILILSMSESYAMIAQVMFAGHRNHRWGFEATSLVLAVWCCEAWAKRGFERLFSGPVTPSFRL